MLQDQRTYFALLLRSRATTPTGQTAIARLRGIDTYATNLVAEARCYGDLRVAFDPSLTSRLILDMFTPLHSDTTAIPTRNRRDRRRQHRRHRI